MKWQMRCARRYWKGVLTDKIVVPIVQLRRLKPYAVRLMYLLRPPSRDEHAYPTVSDDGKAIVHDYKQDGVDTAPILDVAASIVPPVDVDEEAAKDPFTPCEFTIMAFNPCTLRAEGKVMLFLAAMRNARIAMGGLCEARQFDTGVEERKTKDGDWFLWISSAANAKGVYGCTISIDMQVPWAESDG